MNVNSRSQAVATYSAIKDAIKDAAADNPSIKTEGEAYTVSDDVAIKFEGKDYTVLKNSNFDNSLDTVDKVTVREKGSEGGGLMKLRAGTTTFEHKGRTKFFFFQGEQLTVSGVTRQDIPGGFVGGSFTNEFKY